MSSSAWGDKRGKNVKVLDRFKCRSCEVYKPSDNFSIRELDSYRRQVSSGAKVDAITARLRCKGCNGTQVQEIECEGPCGQTKVLDAFSKSQRKNGEYWCKECISWREFQEPNLITEEAPGEEDVTADGYESEGYVATSHEFSNLRISGPATSRASAPQASQPSTLTTRYAVPPHLRPSNNDAESVSSISNIYERLSDVHQPAALAINRPGPVTFVGYDARGRGHLMQKLPSDTEDSESVTTSRVTIEQYSGKGKGKEVFTAADAKHASHDLEDLYD